MTIRVVDIEEMCYLNWYYAGKDYPTNVLSFPFAPPMNVKSSLLGDIVICRQVIEHESNQINIPRYSRVHWAHIVIHGALHLLGYNHIYDTDALLMQKMEIIIIQLCGYKTCCYTTYK